MAEIGNDALAAAAISKSKTCETSKPNEYYDYNEICPDQVSSQHSSPKYRSGHGISRNFNPEHQLSKSVGNIKKTIKTDHNTIDLPMPLMVSPIV